ncbi:MAG: hypothetical protein HYX75_22365 [Acidobacteria bacterium]|nr:hypothetical protein [Acidobacteriota bacterium]
MNPSTFLPTEDLARVNEAIATAERGTAGEIVPVIVGQSSDYKETTYLGGIIGGIMVYFLAAYTTNVELPSRVLLTLATGYICGALLSQIPAVKRLLIGRRFADEEVWRRAALAFQLNQVHHTSARTGIVVLLSLLERTVVVYADQAVASRLEQTTWNGVRDLIVDGIQHGRPADGLIAGISRCGEILSEHFPIQVGDVDELPNRVIIRE